MFGRRRYREIEKLSERIAELELRAPVAEVIFGTAAALVLRAVGSPHRERILGELRESILVSVRSQSTSVDAQNIGLRAEERAQSLLDDIERVARQGDEEKSVS